MRPGQRIAAEVGTWPGVSSGTHRFGGVEFSASEVADLVEAQGAKAVKAMFADAGIEPAGFGLPVDWRGLEFAWAHLRVSFSACLAGAAHLAAKKRRRSLRNDGVFGINARSMRLALRDGCAARA